MTSQEDIKYLETILFTPEPDIPSNMLHHFADPDCLAALGEGLDRHVQGARKSSSATRTAAVGGDDVLEQGRRFMQEYLDPFK